MKNAGVILLCVFVSGCVDVGKLRDQVSQIEQKQTVSAERIDKVSSTAVTQQEVNGLKVQLDANLKASIGSLRDQVSKVASTQSTQAENIGEIKTTTASKQEVNTVKAEIGSLVKDITGIKNDINVQVSAKLRDMDTRLTGYAQKIGSLENGATGGILGIGGSGGIALLVVLVFVVGLVVVTIVIIRKMNIVQFNVKEMTKFVREIGQKDIGINV